ncbi:hypothetical protein EYC80_006461 [Monilinia laxa]|uniref:Uncharacterized protein n=1 Tax=Monilinia laxa TaxID=61186 RepID=A0A5N6JUN1_MONLA|nr:hypothetical protein EYC80_006461 [Monilinia laxa]
MGSRYKRDLRGYESDSDSNHNDKRLRTNEKRSSYSRGRPTTDDSHSSIRYNPRSFSHPNTHNYYQNTGSSTSTDRSDPPHDSMRHHQHPGPSNQDTKSITLKPAFYADIRKPYILADLVSIMEFLDNYKQILTNCNEASRWIEGPPTIDVAFTAFLRENPQIPHLPSYSFPQNAGISGLSDTEEESSMRDIGRNRRMKTEWNQHRSTSPFLPHQSRTPSLPPTPHHISSSFGQSHGSMGPPQLSTRPPPASPFLLSQISTPPPPPTSLPSSDNGILSDLEEFNTPPSQIAITDSGTSIKSEQFSTTLSQPVHSKDKTFIPLAPLTGINNEVRRILIRRYRNLYTREQLCEMLERDLGILTTDVASDPTGI